MYFGAGVVVIKGNKQCYVILTNDSIQCNVVTVAHPRAASVSYVRYPLYLPFSYNSGKVGLFVI